MAAVGSGRRCDRDGGAAAPAGDGARAALVLPVGAVLALAVGAGVGALALGLLGDRVPGETRRSAATDEGWTARQPTPPYPPR